MTTPIGIRISFLTIIVLFGLPTAIWAQNTSHEKTLSPRSAILEDLYLQHDEVVPFLPTNQITSEIRKRQNETGVIFQTDFSPAYDLNEDSHPDGWKRFEGVNYPKYLEMGIVTQRTTLSDQIFQIQMQRGKATVFSPRIRVYKGLSYTSSVFVFVSQLRYDKVFLSLSLLDKDGNVLDTAFSDPVRNTNGWLQLTTDSLVADSPESYYVALGFHVSHPSEKQDMQGLVSFALPRIIEEPVVRFNVSQPWNMYSAEKNILVDGTVSMIRPSTGPATIFLKDPFGQTLQSLQKILYRPEPPGPHRSERDVPPVPTSVNAEPLSETVTFPFQWELPETAPGFYRLSISVPSQGAPIVGQVPTEAHGETVFVVLSPKDDVPVGFYGMTLPEHLKPSELADYKPLIENSGIGRLKFPLWLPEKTERADFNHLVDFCTWLTDQNIDAIGVLCTPPDDVRSYVGDYMTALNLFSLPMPVWYPSMERNVFHFGMVLPDWQLGNDDDLSMSRMTSLPQLLNDINTELAQKGLDITLGLPWNWVVPFPEPSAEAGSVNWGFLSLDNESNMTEQDLEYFLNATQNTDIRRYVSMNALHADRYPLEERIRDLVLKMASGKQFGADAVFLSTPIGGQTGVYQKNQRPTELFLPWRTTAYLLGAKMPTPPIVMPGKSRNFCFRDHAQNTDCLVIWNDVPTEEAMNFGPKAKIVDVWGREFPFSRTEFKPSLQVGPLPIFVVDAETKIMQIRQNLFLHDRAVPSNYGNKLPNKLIFTNPFGYPLSGRIEFVPPQGVVIEPNEFSISVLPGETLEKEITLLLTPSAMSGEVLMETAVNLQGWDDQNFSVYEFLHIGSQDVGIELATFFNRQGQLEVLQTFVNNTEDEVSFSCTLYVPERPMQRVVIKKAGFGRHDAKYLIENAGELMGRPARIVATEVGGDRVLKHQFIIGE